VSYDRVTTSYVLTCVGWLVADGEIAEPVIQYWEKVTYQGSGYGRQSEDWRLLSTSGGMTDDELIELHSRFPKPSSPRELSPEMLAKLLEAGESR
jgi:hypothetical protein